MREKESNSATKKRSVAAYALVLKARKNAYLVWFLNVLLQTKIKIKKRSRESLIGKKVHV